MWIKKKIGIDIEKELDKYVALVCWQLSFKIPLSVNLRSKSNFKIYNFPIEFSEVTPLC